MDNICERFNMSQAFITSRYDEYLSHIQDILLETHVFKSYLTELFYFNANHVDIMNDSASTFFVMCENSFVESIIMRISKVTDPESTGRNENLTIKTLFKHFFSEDDPDYEEVKRKLDELDAQIKNLRKRRSKQLGHIDLKSLGKEFPLSLANIDNALVLLEGIFNHIVRKLPEGLEKFKPDTHYVLEPSMIGSGDAVAALIMLEKGRRYSALIDQLPEECLQSLLPSPDTWLERGIFPGIERHYFEDDVIQFVCSKDTGEPE